MDTELAELPSECGLLRLPPTIRASAGEQRSLRYPLLFGLTLRWEISLEPGEYLPPIVTNVRGIRQPVSFTPVSYKADRLPLARKCPKAFFRLLYGYEVE